MKQQYIEKKILYNGTQLRSLFSYFEFGIMGNSIVSWMGPCQVDFDHMVDGEDLIARETIAGNEMLHFLIEIFDRDLFSAVCLQRLMASLFQEYIFNKTKKFLKRDGDDLFLNQSKLSISIASKSPVSVMIHFAVNMTNAGTPVPTLSLADLQLEPRKVALDIMGLFVSEFESITRATQKVKPLR